MNEAIGISLAPVSKVHRWVGMVLSGLVVAFLLFDFGIHISKIPPVLEAFKILGYNADVIVTIAILELVCLILYVIPKTSILGAILLTGYLGGAVASNLRIDKPLVSTILFPVYVGIFLWGGLWFRENRLRELIPFKR